MYKKGLTVIGFCMHPDYKGKSGVAMVYEDGDFNKGWIHVNDYILYKWAVELQRTPPEDVIWEKDMIKEYLFK